MTTIPAGSAYSVSSDRPAFSWGRVSWNPVMMGAISAIGLQFIFTVLGIALGTSMTNARHDATDTTVQTISIAAGLWWLITGTISLAVGGYIYGRLAALPRSVPLMLGGVSMWAVVALFGFLVVWSGAGMAASPIGMLADDGRSRSSMMSTRTSGDATTTASGTSTGRNADAATIDARAEEARRATRTASWWSVFGLILGIVASVGGAYMAVPDEDDRSRDRRAEPAGA